MQNINLGVISSCISAACAFISVLCVIITNYIHSKEKYSLVRPAFYLKANSEGSLKVEFLVKILYNNRCKIINIEWISNSDIKEINDIIVNKRDLKNSQFNDYNFYIDLDYHECKDYRNNIKGKIVLTYINIYEKIEKCEAEIDFESLNFRDGDYFVLKKSKVFI